jgi:transcription antitermination factor NusG
MFDISSALHGKVNVVGLRVANVDKGIPQARATLAAMWGHQVRYYGKRKFTVELPLFPSYVFLRGSIEEAYDSNRTKRVANVISVNNQTQIDWELHNLFLVMENGASLDPFPYLTTGTRVEVRAGPFRGVQGVIDSRLKSDRLILQIDMLGRAVSLEVDGALLDVVDHQVRGYAN